ncbi:MAG: hypothetical protein KC983_03635, partial [Phycisphaerales bacterium]|nr:hypothetical protein [Phycisphaerales bacterium]
MPPSCCSTYLRTILMHVAPMALGAAVVCTTGCTKSGPADTAASKKSDTAEAPTADRAPEVAAPVTSKPVPAIEVPEPTSFDTFHPASADHIRAMIAAVRAAPDDLEAWTRLGMVYHANDLRELAAPCYEFVIARAPNAARPLYYAALLNYDRGYIETAFAYLNRARKAEPEY